MHKLITVQNNPMVFTDAKCVHIPSTTFPSESTLHAFIMSDVPLENNSKQLARDFSLGTSRTCIFSRGIIPLGSLSYSHKQTITFKMLV